LADFHANEGNTLAATYLLSGQVVKTHDEDMDMDDRDSLEEEDEWEEGEYVEQIEMVLVGERELESKLFSSCLILIVIDLRRCPSAVHSGG
jgi:hypothetical protein